MVVTFGRAGVDAREVHPHLDLGPDGWARFDPDMPTPAVKLPLDLLDHNVPKRERQRRAGRVHLPALAVGNTESLSSRIAWLQVSCPEKGACRVPVSAS